MVKEGGVGQQNNNKDGGDDRSLWGFSRMGSITQVTTEGKVKVIDRIDGSGAGDVDTSTVVTAVDGAITGLTTRKLKIPETWVNPSGKYHIGVKGSFSLYPKQLRERLTKQRKDKTWDPIHKELLADAQRKALEVQKNSSNSSSGTNGNGSGGGAGNNNSSSSSLLEKLAKEDAESRVSQLNALEKKYSDLGPAYDCVVYHDGQVWRACVDTSECGELADGLHLGEYRLTHQWSALTHADHYTVSVNVHNDGNLLEIVGMCSSHGTHVASIASANFPDNPDRNGVAPGAQIVSITIGDNRITGMETGTALARAMMRVMKNPHYTVNVINMSYGEHAHWSDSGRLGELAHEVVNKYGVLWVASAGNHGPALATVGVPPDFQSDSIIGVGAYVSPDMMMAEYSMIEKLPGCPYTWSSRGPTEDGARGVTVCAPGGAITSVPTFTLRSNQLMNGTSMASPHTAGCVALILSALKLKSIPYSPYSVRRCIQNTALHLDMDVFAQGHGLIQSLLTSAGCKKLQKKKKKRQHEEGWSCAVPEKVVERAVEHLIQQTGGVEDKVRFAVECGSERKKGIHIRNWKADKPVDVSVAVEPVMLNDMEADPNEKLAFCMELVMTCDAPWVKAPGCLQMSYTIRSFQVSIDPRGLERGRVYFTSVKAYNASNVEKGVMFEVPITIVVPCLELYHGYQYSCPAEVFRAGHIRRHFIYVPLEATWATVSLKTSHSDKCQRFTLHAVQLKPKSSVKTLEYYKVTNLGCNETSNHVFSVRGGFTLEVCLARWWSSLVDGQVQIFVEFHSLRPSQEEVTLLCSESVQRVDVWSGLRNEEMSPQATLKHHAQVLMPSESKVEVLGGPRDTIPESRPMYQLILSYSLALPKQAEVTPRCAVLNDVLYESILESQLWMLYDHNKQLLGCGDAYSSKYSLKLEKGDYTIRLHVRHERPDLLEKLSDLPLTILTKLTQEVKLDVYTTFNAAVASGKKAQTVTMPPGTCQPIYLTAPSLSDKTLKGLGLTPGQALIGTLSFAKDEQVRKAVSSHKFGPIRTMPCNKFLLVTNITILQCNKFLLVTNITILQCNKFLLVTNITILQCNKFLLVTNITILQCNKFLLDQYLLRVVVTEMPCKKRNTSNANSEEKKEAKTYNEYLEALRDLQTAWISKLDNENGEQLHKEVMTAHPDHLAAQLARLQALDAVGAQNRAAVIAQATKIVSAVDTAPLLAFYGTKTDTRSDAAKFKTQMDKQRNGLLEALSRQGSAVCADVLAASPPEAAPDVLEQLDTIAAEIMKFVDPTDSKVSGFFISYYRVRKFDSLAVRLIARQCEEKMTRDNEAKLTEAYNCLGWTHISALIANSHPLRFPTSYAPF
ncbi:Tripeptidyl-peptidase 2 [Chionoecetes opilio]|uniref:Tripeptidyl-peptidase 2 n=1 Tax=Chionoecetes opilio TaxID=41210 RepID=A0A8J4XZ35_CHIOP|nr:Tripeptidyl-peptidase 2 [Chionoecetes opilio]